MPTWLNTPPPVSAWLPKTDDELTQSQRASVFVHKQPPPPSCRVPVTDADPLMVTVSLLQIPTATPRRDVVPYVEESVKTIGAPSRLSIPPPMDAVFPLLKKRRFKVTLPDLGRPVPVLRYLHRATLLCCWLLLNPGSLMSLAAKRYGRFRMRCLPDTKMIPSTRPYPC